MRRDTGAHSQCFTRSVWLTVAGKAFIPVYLPEYQQTGHSKIRWRIASNITNSNDRINWFQLCLFKQSKTNLRISLDRFHLIVYIHTELSQIAQIDLFSFYQLHLNAFFIAKFLVIQNNHVHSMLLKVMQKAVRITNGKALLSGQSQSTCCKVQRY